MVDRTSTQPSLSCRSPLRDLIKVCAIALIVDRTYGRSTLLFNPTFFVTYDHTIFRGKKQRSRSLVFGDRNHTVLEQEIVS